MENITWEIVRVLFYLVLVIGFIYLLNFFLKNGITGKSKGRYIKVLEQVYLSPKKSLSLIKIHDQVLLISNTDTDIKVLYSWDEKEFPEPGHSEDGESFKEYFQKFSKSNRRGRDE